VHVVVVVVVAVVVAVVVLLLLVVLCICACLYRHCDAHVCSGGPPMCIFLNFLNFVFEIPAIFNAQPIFISVPFFFLLN